MTRRSTAPRRLVEAAIFEGDIGPVSAQDLLAMPTHQWGNLRDRITDQRQGRSSGLFCRCMMCGDPVFIRTRAWNGQSLPHFAHFQNGGRGCPWRTDATKHPDAVRAAQYGGRQESVAHRLLCEHILDLARLDPRHEKSAVNAYRPPTANEHGRFPDVSVTWRGFPEFVVEVQLSNTFQTEISARSTHYEREGVALIWVLYGVDPRVDALPQSFADVVRRHRGNAFLLDQEAITASRERRTLVLQCYLQNASGGFDAPRLAAIDELQFPADCSPFLEDRVSTALLTAAKSRRRVCFNYLKAIETDTLTYALTGQQQARALIEELRSVSPHLSQWEEDAASEEHAILRLIAVVFSMIEHANNNRKNYATKHPTVAAMLNTWLNGRADVQRYALIIEHVIQTTPLATSLQSSVAQHLARAKEEMDGNLCLPGESEWIVMRYLLPELFDPVMREELRYFGALPRWANPATVT